MTPYLQTFTGSTYDLEAPDPSSISLAWAVPALAQICRYTGHSRRFYSVAQHCVIGARVLRDHGHGEDTQRYFLLHDLHESVTGDVASPIKKAIGPAWGAFEEKHRLAFATRFQIARTVPAAVKVCDLRMLITERDQCLAALRPGERNDGWPPGVDAYEGVKITPWGADVAAGEYTAEARRLGVL